MTALLEGHKVIVTGGASGIGAATVRRLATEGARVAILDRNGEVARDVALEVDGVAFDVNVANAESLAEAVVLAGAALGGLTALVNNAGMGNLKPLHEYSEKEWDLLLDVNLKAVWVGTKAAIPLLRAAGGGSIVNVASVSGVRPTRGESPYAAAKAGVIALTQSTALEYAPTIRANCVSPGLIDTALTAAALHDPASRALIEAGTPLGRIGGADEIAATIAFLCSDEAGYLTGQNLVVDGGSMLPHLQTDGFLRGLLGE